jgi:hypothetical protein
VWRLFPEHEYSVNSLRRSPTNSVKRPSKRYNSADLRQPRRTVLRPFGLNERKRLRVLTKSVNRRSFCPASWLWASFLLISVQLSGAGQNRCFRLLRNRTSRLMFWATAAGQNGTCTNFSLRRRRIRSDFLSCATKASTFFLCRCAFAN